MHACTCTHIKYTHTQIYIHVYRNTIHIDITHRHTNKHMHLHKYTYLHIYTHVHACIHTYTRRDMHSHIHTSCRERHQQCQGAHLTLWRPHQELHKLFVGIKHLNPPHSQRTWEWKDRELEIWDKQGTWKVPRPPCHSVGDRRAGGQLESSACFLMDNSVCIFSHMRKKSSDCNPRSYAEAMLHFFFIWSKTSPPSMFKIVKSFNENPKVQCHILKQGPMRLHRKAYQEKKNDQLPMYKSRWGLNQSLVASFS